MKKNNAIDWKFKFEAHNLGNGNRFTEKEGVVFLAKDNCFLPALIFYREECVRQNVSKEQIEGIDLLIDRVKEWRKENPNRCKAPDIALGKEAENVLLGATQKSDGED